MKRKPLRPDWRKMPAKRMIPAMSRQQLLLRHFRVGLPVDVAEMQRFGEKLVATANAMPPLPFHSVHGMADDLGSALARLAMLSPFPVALSRDSKGRIVGISYQRVRHDQKTVIGD